MDNPTPTPMFYHRPGVQLGELPVAGGVPYGLEPVCHPPTGIGGVYGAWGQGYDNAALLALIEQHLGRPLEPAERMDLPELGFLYRHHIPNLSEADHLELELDLGARAVRAAAEANGWDPAEVDALMVGVSCPVCPDFTARIARRVGLPERALRVTIHKACDSSVSALHLALNPQAPENRRGPLNLAHALEGKKVLLGGIEGLSRFLHFTRDVNALQLFGNAFGLIGVVPGRTMQFLAGASHEAFDEEGVLQVRMRYPHARNQAETGSHVDLRQESERDLRVAGCMHEPADGSSVAMAGPMGMVKLFVRTGVQTVLQAVAAYRAHLEALGTPERTFATAVVHHANYKINKLKEKHLLKEGIRIPMPWVLSEFGNVSAASPMIAFLRQLPGLRPGDHLLVDGFGAGTYYDVVAVEV